MKETPTNQPDRTPPLKPTDPPCEKPRKRGKEDGTWANLLRVRYAAAKAG